MSTVSVNIVIHKAITDYLSSIVGVYQIPLWVGAGLGSFCLLIKR